MIQAEVTGTKRPGPLNHSILQDGVWIGVTVPSAGKFGRESRYVCCGRQPEPGSGRQSGI